MIWTLKKRKKKKRKRKMTPPFLKKLPINTCPLEDPMK